MVPESVVERWREWRGSEDTVVVVGGEGYADVKDGMVAEVVGYNHGVEEAEKMNKSENASESFFLWSWVGNLWFGKGMCL